MSDFPVPATLSDLDPILALLGEIRDWLAARGIAQWSGLWPREELEREIRDGEIYVVRGEKELLATVTLNEKHDSYWPELPEPALYLSRLGVRRLPETRGLGCAILNWAEEEAHRRGLPFLRLSVDAKNDRLRLYYWDRGFPCLGVEHDPRYGMDFALFEKPVSKAF